MKINQESQKHIILFDGDCNFCDATVQKIIKYDKNDCFRFAAQQSEIGQRLMKANNCANQSLNTVILIQGKSAYVKSDAVIEVFKILFGFSFVVNLLRWIPLFFRNYMYDFFANRRYQWFGKKTICSIPTPAIRAKFLH
ncbi:MAG: DCC1-like thiol-disulfide oxidoreductase family protein [Sphingobacteriaceae bacterium]|nr:DCC1-like thiol-disulfide oxidoreductase family protein [Sphingobacteriaceae bacterium]